LKSRSEIPLCLLLLHLRANHEEVKNNDDGYKKYERHGTAATWLSLKNDKVEN
jgi:hypothetical protein